VTPTPWTRAELSGPYEIVMRPGRRGSVEEWEERYGVDDLRAVTHRQLREYLDGVPTFMGCAWLRLRMRDERPHRAGICYRPRGHDGDHRYILLSPEDSCQIMRRVALWARRTAPAAGEEEL
jgi:hypothetical protein